MQTTISQSATAPMGGPHRILVIDDDASMRLLAACAMEAHGFQVCQAESGRAGLAALADGRFDAVILDLRMPDLEGFEVCTALRAIPGCEELPVIVVSGRDDNAGIERAYAAGATDYLYKPVNWTQFIHKLRLVLDAREDREQLICTRDERDALAASIPDTLLRLDACGAVAEWTPGSECPLVLVHAIEALGQAAGPDGAGLSDELEGELRALARQGGEHQFELRDGAQSHWFQARATASAAGSGVIIIRDITAQRRDAQQLEYLALRDPETGLGNRHWLQKRLGIFEQAAENSAADCVVYRVLIDNAPEWLELFGPGRFEELMRQLAQRALVLCRAKPYVALECRPSTIEFGRSGSGEFTLLELHEGGPADRVKFATRLVEVLSGSLWQAGMEVTPRVRIGVATAQAGQKCGDEVFQQAGIAMLQAAPGAEQVRCYETSHLAHRIASIDLESRLRRALQNDELFLHYQPQFSGADGSLTGFEALLRWRNGGRLISPAEFIPVAESSGLIVEIGDRVLESACRQIAEWSAQGYDVPSIAVNLSAVQLTATDFPARIRELLATYDVSPACLEIEITESLLMEDCDSIQKALQEIRACGVRIALDDFGTGYASLGYLHKYPLDLVKIDRSFVGGVPSGDRSENIIRAIVAMARALCMKVVAEGVETADQLSFLEDIGCDFVQGYLTGRPQPVEEATALLAARQPTAETLAQAV